MELWDLYNKNREKIGKTIVRGQKIPSGEYHIYVHIWTINDDGKLLIQKRSENKEDFPGMWSITGGAAIKDENSKECAIREFKEELGISLNIEDAKLLNTFKESDYFVDIWFLKQNINLNDLKLQENEVSEVKWVSIQEIEDLIEQDKFTTVAIKGFETCKKYIKENGYEF